MSKDDDTWSDEQQWPYEGAEDDFETKDDAWDAMDEADYYNGTGDNDDNSGSDYYDRD